MKTCHLELGHSSGQEEDKSKKNHWDWCKMNGNKNGNTQKTNADLLAF
jgi:hypothetical protein